MGSQSYFGTFFLNTIFLNFQRFSCSNEFPVKNLSLDQIKLSTNPLNKAYLGLFWTTLWKNNVSISITVAKQGPKSLDNAPMGLNFLFNSKCHLSVLILPIIFHAHLKQSKLALKLHLLGDQRVLDQMTRDKNFWALFDDNYPLFHYI